MDYERATGWLVRVYRVGTTHSKFFADSLHGGKSRARKAALEYLAVYEALHPSIPPPPPPPVMLDRPALASTKVRGVSETFQRHSSGRKVPCFSVSYRLEGVRQNKRFYHHRFTSRRAALKAATQFRKDVEEQMLREHRKRLREWTRKQKVSGKAR
ncbi:MAG: hypothetical protein ACSLFQ_22440 [Thermoanaerobaculia bacterium]